MNQKPPTLAAAALIGLLVCAAPVAAQTVHLAVFVGLAGDPEHGETFRRWAGTLVDSASGKLGVAREHIVYLLDDPTLDAARATGKSTNEEITRALGTFAKNAGPDDVVFVVLIGHGTFDGKVAKFNLPGPDMTPSDFSPLLAKIQARHLVFVNTTSSSAPFIPALAGPGRTIVTATRTGAERFATLFGGAFIDALTGDAADADKNKRVSVLEAFNAAKLQVARTYEQEGLMLTEHPLLDDSGDAEGSATPAADGKNGRLAAVVALGSAVAAEPATSDPALRALYAEKRALETRVEGLKLLKDSMDRDRYASELEKLLTDLALKSRQIKELEGKGKL